MENNIQLIPVETEEKRHISFNFADVLRKCLKCWYWFVLSLVLCLSAATVYVMRKRPVYQSSATVLIKEASARRMATSDIESVINFSGSSMSSKVVNEVIAFKSPALMSKVVERLDLNTEYSVDKLLRTDIIYGSQVPVTVSFLDIPSNVSADFTLSPSENGYTVSKFKYCDPKSTKVEGTIAGNFGDTLATAAGHVVINPNPTFMGSWTKPVLVTRRTTQAATNAFLSQFNAAQEDVKNKSDVLNLSIKDASVQRANDILNMMITIYNENWVEDKNKMARSTTQFIDERLAALEVELKVVDDDISTYKSDHLIPESTNVADYALQDGRETIALSRDAENKLYVLRFLRNFLHDNPGTDVIIPLVASFNNHGVGEQIAEYNRLLLQRDNLQANSSDQNPLVVSMGQALSSMRSAIDTAVTSQIENLELQIKELKKKEDITTNTIAQSPSQVKYLTTIGRQQKVKEALYLYLLQKREENELSQAFTAYNTRIITPPMGKSNPIAPKKMYILLVAFALAIVIPFVSIYISVVTDNKIHIRKDVENLSIPFLGEIPQLTQRRSKILSLIQKKEDAKDLVVKEGVRDVINEAFRVLRTNLEFMTKGNKCPVLLLTSFQPGSGKTFLSINTTKVMSIKGKKVLAIDGDMRHASLSEFVDSPKLGLSNYLSGEVDDYKSVVYKHNGKGTLDIIPSGIIPPNPSELISSDRFVTLLEQARTEYDYIFIDCPPIDIVADTQVIQDLADRTIFVVRAGLLDKSMLPKIEKMYQEKKFKNLCLVLNGTNSANGIYGAKNGYYTGQYDYYNLKG